MRAAQKCIRLFAVLAIIISGRKVAGRLRFRHVPKIYDFGLCPDKKYLSHMTSKNITLNDDGFETINANVTLEKDMNQISKVSLILHRCAGAVSFDQCEYYHTFTWGAAVCQVMVMKGVFWTPAIGSIRPIAKCPAKKGDYTVRNGALDYDQLGDLLGSSFEKFIWKAEVLLYNELKDFIACMFAVGEIRRVPVKPK